MRINIQNRRDVNNMKSQIRVFAPTPVLPLALPAPDLAHAEPSETDDFTLVLGGGSHTNL